jgi:hypothetical protein
VAGLIEKSRTNALDSYWTAVRQHVLSNIPTT